MTRQNPRARALDLAIPVASCAAAGIRATHLLADASRDELLALVGILAAAADPVRLRTAIRHPGEAAMSPEARTETLRRAHAAFTRLTRAGLPIPYDLRVLDSEYQADVKRRRAAAAVEQMTLAPARELEPCPSLAAYRRHKAQGEPYRGLRLR